jgi:hypothetical protein
VAVKLEFPDKLRPFLAMFWKETPFGLSSMMNPGFEHKPFLNLTMKRGCGHNGQKSTAVDSHHSSPTECCTVPNTRRRAGTSAIPGAGEGRHPYCPKDSLEARICSHLHASGTSGCGKGQHPRMAGRHQLSTCRGGGSSAGRFRAPAAPPL